MVPNTNTCINGLQVPRFLPCCVWTTGTQWSDVAVRSHYYQNMLTRNTVIRAAVGVALVSLVVAGGVSIFLIDSQFAQIILAVFVIEHIFACNRFYKQYR